MRFISVLMISALALSTAGLAQNSAPQPAPFTDIVQGGNRSEPHPNRGYMAEAGHDAVTGWGVPDGKALLAALRRTP